MKSTKIDKSRIESISTRYSTETGTLKIGNAEFANTYGDGDFYLGFGPIENSDNLIGVVTDGVIQANPFATIYTDNGAGMIFFGKFKLNGRWAVCQAEEGAMKLKCLDAEHWLNNLEFDGEFNSYNCEGKEVLIPDDKD